MTNRKKICAGALVHFWIRNFMLQQEINKEKKNKSEEGVYVRMRRQGFWHRHTDSLKLPNV